MLPIIIALIAVSPVQVLRWQSPDSSRPLSYSTWLESRPAGPAWRIRPVSAAGPRLEPGVDILVEEGLLAPLRPQFDTLMLDLGQEGFAPALYSVAGTSAESLRAFLVREYEAGVRHALFVGDLPVAWFQMIDDWNSNGRRDPDEGYEEFPCELFFMDIDGNWADQMVRLDTLDSLVPGADGIYDRHDGDILPEMAVSRLPASAIGNELTLLSRYLDKAHRYRTGSLPVTDRALVYIDDDWVPNASEWDNSVGYLYPERVFVWHRETTRVRDYRPRIDTAAYQWIQLCSHSWPGGHAMKYNNGQSWDYFYADQIAGLDPQASFYNLFACSNVRFVERGYCGGCYVFQTSTGLGAVGSTKTGSMLRFEDFYFALGEGRPLAEALIIWFYWRMIDGVEPWERSWFYGMCLVGDGTLKARVPTALAEGSLAPVASRPLVPATVVSRLLTVSPDNRTTDIALVNAAGRRVLVLNPGANDVSCLTPGVYFIRSSAAGVSNTRRIIVPK